MTEDTLFWGLVTGEQLWSYLGALLMAAALAYVAKKWPSKAGEIIGRALAEIGDAVREVYQTYVEAIKEGRAEGKLTDAEKAEAKRRALEIVKSNLGKKGIAALMRVLGTDVLDNWLGSKVETAVAGAKVVGTAAKGGAASTAPLPAPPR